MISKNITVCFMFHSYTSFTTSKLTCNLNVTPDLFGIVCYITFEPGPCCSVSVSGWQYMNYMLTSNVRECYYCRLILRHLTTPRYLCPRSSHIPCLRYAIYHVFSCYSSWHIVFTPFVQCEFMTQGNLLCILNDFACTRVLACTNFQTSALKAVLGALDSLTLLTT